MKKKLVKMFVIQTKSSVAKTNLFLPSPWFNPKSLSVISVVQFNLV